MTSSTSVTVTSVAPALAAAVVAGTIAGSSTLMMSAGAAAGGVDEQLFGGVARELRYNPAKPHDYDAILAERKERARKEEEERVAREIEKRRKARSFFIVAGSFFSVSSWVIIYSRSWQGP